MNMKITPDGYICYQKYDGEPWVMIQRLGTCNEVVIRGAERKNCLDCQYFEAVDDHKCESCMWHYQDNFRKSAKVVGD